MLSIIIPAKNEQEYLPKTLESIRQQDFLDYEIIVADAGSTDATASIAQKYGCRVVEGGLPSRGRNNGAKAAKGSLFFFLDADTILPEEFFKKALEEFARRQLGIAGFPLVPYPRHWWSSFLLNIFYSIPIAALERISAHAAMGILVKKSLFEQTKGFDETVTLAEDHDFASRASKKDKFGIIRSTYVLFSDRRFKKEGWLKLGLKYFLCELHLIFIGPIRSDIFQYKFDHYKEKP